jgi:hypothetical protein
MSKFCLKKNNNLVDTNPKEDNCSICLDKKTDVATIDCCCHDFCFKCISRSVKTQQNCPLCRKKISKIIKKDDVSITNFNSSINDYFSILNWEMIEDRDRIIYELSSQNLLSIIEDRYDTRSKTHIRTIVKLTGLGTLIKTVVITDNSTAIIHNS